MHHIRQTKSHECPWNAKTRCMKLQAAHTSEAAKIDSMPVEPASLTSLPILTLVPAILHSYCLPARGVHACLCSCGGSRQAGSLQPLLPAASVQTPPWTALDRRMHQLLRKPQPPSPATLPAGSPRRRTRLHGSARTAACHAAGGRSGCRCAGAWGGAGWQGQRAWLGGQPSPCRQPGAQGVGYTFLQPTASSLTRFWPHLSDAAPACCPLLLSAAAWSSSATLLWP